MFEPVRIERLTAEHLLALEVQPSQSMQIGMPLVIDQEHAERLASSPHGIAALEYGNGSYRVAACMGVIEAYAGRQGVAWAFFAENLMRVHIAFTRAARALIANSGLRRIEAVLPAPQDAQTLAEALAAPTPECRWASILGVKPVYLLRAFGAASEPFVLHERIVA